MIKRFLDSLFGRFLLIIIIPVILIQIVISVVFFERHWQNISRYMINGVAGEMQVIANICEKDCASLKSLVSPLGMNAHYFKGKLVNQNKAKINDDFLQDLHEKFAKRYSDFWCSYSDKDKTKVMFSLQLSRGVLEFTFSKKRIYSRTINIFMIWVILATFVLLVVAVIFMKNQIRSILRLSEVAEKLGRGQEIGYFKPSGAREIRIAGKSFIRMKKRIERNIKYKTDLLAHISHDLRTPLTRLSLQIAMLPPHKEGNMQKEIMNMSNMIQGYIDFARGEGNEITQKTNIVNLLHEIAAKYADKRIKTNFATKNIVANIRISAVSRAISNLIDNALKHCNLSVNLSIEKHPDCLYICVRDDGPGIDENKLKEAFKPFTKLDEGGYGLGLAIVKNISQSHGGDIKLYNKKNKSGSNIAFIAKIEIPIQSD